MAKSLRIEDVAKWLYTQPGLTPYLKETLSEVYRCMHTTQGDIMLYDAQDRSIQTTIDKVQDYVVHLPYNKATEVLFDNLGPNRYASVRRAIGLKNYSDPS